MIFQSHSQNCYFIFSNDESGRESTPALVGAGVRLTIIKDNARKVRAVVKERTFPITTVRATRII